MNRPLLLWSAMFAMTWILFRIGKQQSSEVMPMPSAGPSPTVALLVTQTDRQLQLNEVLLATRDLDPVERSVLTTEDVRVFRMPDEIFVPEGAIHKVEQLVGKVLVSKIYEGEILVASRFSTRDLEEHRGLKDFIDRSQRAISLQVDAASGTVGFLDQGDRVDVVALYSAAGTLFSRIILENVEVLARGDRHVEQPVKSHQTRIEGDAGTITVTLKVDAMKALRLAHLADRNGVNRFCLILRNPDDDTPSNTRGILLREILDGVPRRPPVEMVERQEVVEVLRGTGMAETVDDQPDPIPAAPYDPMDPYGIERASAAEALREEAAARKQVPPRPQRLQAPGEFYGVFEDVPVDADSASP